MDEVSVGAAAGGSALGVLALGVLGVGVSGIALGVAGLVEAELSGTLDVSEGALVAGEVDAVLGIERLFAVAFTDFVVAFFGAEVLSSTIAVSCGREAAGAGAASATTVEGGVVVVVVAVSPTGDTTFVSRPEAGAAVATGATLPTS